MWSAVRRRIWLIVLFGLFVALLSVWIEREPLLAGIGGLVVEETELQPSDVAVLLSDNAVLAAVEGAALVNRGYAPRVLLFTPPRPTEEEILARLGIAVPKPHEVSVLVMRQMGVPPDAILVEPIRVRGTNAEVRSVARYAQEHRVTRLIVVTYRSHTRRTAILLRRYLPESSTVIARSSSHDSYRPERWWRERESTRELLVECLRWVNSFLAGDLWRENEAQIVGGGLDG